MAEAQRTPLDAKRLRTADFDFHLPPELIAQRPAAERTASRLLVLGLGKEGIQHRRFAAIADLLRPGDLLVVNDTQVLKARLAAVKDSGGRAEILVERIEDDTRALCQVRASKALKPGRALCVAGQRCHVLERRGAFYLLRFDAPVADVLEHHGEVPLPPYIERPPEATDEERYQTVYAAQPGAVAAPTAGLHFDATLLARVQAQGVTVAPVTLHVGAGTFQPVRDEDLAQHRLHTERYAIPPATRRALDACTGRVVAVGTTVVRTLEAAAASGSDSGETALFIRPGYRFRVVDALVTNFHLPRSTLLMLVSAFAGVDATRDAYEEAVAHRYRFYSYGDAMFCERAGNVAP